MIVDGGTLADLARNQVLISFNLLEPKGTKKTIDDILRSRNITDQVQRYLCVQEAEGLVAERALLYDKEGVFVFSKDEQSGYSWEPAGYKDRIRGFVNRYL